MHPLLAASLVNSLSRTNASPRPRRPPRRQGREARPPARADVRAGRGRHQTRQCRRRARRSSASPRSTATTMPARVLAASADAHAVLVAEVDGELEAALAVDDGLTVADPFRPSAPHRRAARPARPPARRRRARATATPALRVLQPAHVVTSGRCCRPARRLPAPSRPGSGWRARRRCCAAAPPATASRSRCAPRGRTRRWSSSRTPRRCARSSPRRSTSRSPGRARRSSSRSSGRARSSCSTAPRTCASAS